MRSRISLYCEYMGAVFALRAYNGLKIKSISVVILLFQWFEIIYTHPNTTVNLKIVLLKHGQNI